MERSRPPSTKETKRSLGLDITRSTAIGAVLLCHVSILHSALFPPAPGVTTGSVLLGYYGVELFFVLSGFLIGEILLRDVLPKPSAQSIGRFFVRRWMRILPAYYVVLFFLLAIEALTPQSFKPHWDYVFFVQNYDHGAELFFPVSWSLTIEQWSYVLAPIVLLGLPGLFAHATETPARQIWLSLASVFIFFLALRLWAALDSNTPWDMGFRKQIHLRLDAVFFGVLIASIRHFKPALFQRLAAASFFTATLAGLLTLIAYQGVLMITHNSPNGPDGSLLFKSLGFTLTDLLLALTLPFMSNYKHVQDTEQAHSRLSRLFTACSRYAYSLYLVHFTIFTLVHNQLIPFRTMELGSRLAVMTLGTAVALLSSLAVAALLHHFIEQPGMDLRKRMAA